MKYEKAKVLYFFSGIFSDDFFVAVILLQTGAEGLCGSGAYGAERRGRECDILAR